MSAGRRFRHLVAKKAPLQIPGAVNAYCALGKVSEAKTANERAKWLLKKMPAEAFAEGGFTMPKEYWDKWLTWTSASGLW